MGYNTEILSYPSRNGRDMVWAKLFLPADRDIRAIVQISHGMCEYLDRYQPLAEFLCARGFLVCGNNHIGHRYTSRDADLGYFARRGGFRCLIDDVHQLARQVRERFLGLPHFLLGHSMGSFIARCYLMEHGEGLDGAVLSGTGGPNPFVDAGLKLSSLLCATRGPKGHSKLLEHLAFGKYNERFEPRSSKEWISRDRAVVDAYLADPYCMFPFSNAAYRDLFELHKRANEPGWASKLVPDLPVYLFSGTDDPVGGYGDGVRHVYQDIKDAGLFDVTLKLYPGGRHEMLNETNRDEVFGDLYDWLRRKI